MSEYSIKVRRTDRQETDEAFLTELLNESVSCSIAIEKEGFPMMHVAFFVYDEANREVIFHFSKYGYAGQEITDGKKVCVSVYKHGKLYTANKAVDFGCEYQSVIIYGKLRIVTDEVEHMEAMQVFFNKFFGHVPQDTYEPMTAAQAKPIYVAKIRIENWIGKQHLVPDVALNNFYYPASPVI
ncbi:pyridoxamine 5'-phosphate oxidase family protein [Emticicia sp. BO119]|uniref:pyridoxamine 5'-phosphate oxidase family protein n=1 Tax=Emticicia sp. BO119 TaxID=2757768 RepID=UPI0015F031D2|nr:pyridoxamine 5'-phosphate oxidase family protein [Emticicia sp. BO119]MBA4853793.1 pyridoxamine 5'-phosphate oxidase family protein [Emticicia sp. BO119]